MPPWQRVPDGFLEGYAQTRQKTCNHRQMDSHLQFDRNHLLLVTKGSTTTRAHSSQQHAHERLTRLATPRTQPSYIPAHTDLPPTPFDSVPYLHHAFLTSTMRSGGDSVLHNKTPAKCSVPCSFGTLPCPHSPPHPTMAARYS